jgi:hypothetical protein
MKHQLFLFCLIVGCLCLSCDSKHDFENEFKNYFVKYYGENGDQEAVDMVLNSDGTVFILGTTENVPGEKRIILFKVNDRGEVLWKKVMGGGADVRSELPQDLEIDVDGNLLILTNMFFGIDPFTNEGLYDFKVIRVKPSGEAIDSVVFNNNAGQWKTQFLRSITPFENGGFAVTGNSTDESVYTEPQALTDFEDIVTLVYDRDLQLSDWLFQTPGEQYGSGVKVFKEREDLFYVFTYSDRKLDSHASANSNFNVFKTNEFGIPDGDANNNNSSGIDGKAEVLKDVCKVPTALGGGFFEFGTSKSSLDAASGSLYFCRRSQNLTKMDEGYIGNLTGNLSAVSISPAVVNEGFLIVANEQTTSGSTIRLSKLNLSNQAVWSINVGSFNKNNQGAKVIELPSGRILLLGTIELETQRKISLIKLNRNGELLN